MPLKKTTTSTSETTSPSRKTKRFTRVRYYDQEVTVILCNRRTCIVKTDDGETFAVDYKLLENIPEKDTEKKRR